MEIIRKYFVSACVLLVWMNMVCCAKEDAYKSITKGGEIVYPGRVDSVYSQAGNQRLQLKVLLANDPLVTQVRVFWNNHGDSIVANVQPGADKDTLTVLINDLSEGVYSFNVYSYNKENNRSVVQNVTGTVYGENYLKSINLRSIRAIEQSADGLQVHILWNEAMAGEVRINLKYFDSTGSARILSIDGGSIETILPSYKGGSTIEYKSLFVPELNAIDTFSSEKGTAKLPLFERKLDNLLFRDFFLPTDVGDAWGWLKAYLWDDNYNPPGFATQSGASQWFSLDLGGTYAISKMKMWQATDRLYKDENVEQFEVWGANSPNLDGSWASWKKIDVFESVKPSGLPLGEMTQADIDYAVAGEQFTFPKNTPKYRYLRFKLLKNWGDRDFMTIGEFSFWTHDR